MVGGLLGNIDFELSSVKYFRNLSKYYRIPNRHLITSVISISSKINRTLKKISFIGLLPMSTSNKSFIFM